MGRANSTTDARGRVLRIGVSFVLAAFLSNSGAARAADPPSTSDPAELRSYRTANGLLDRGLHQMAVEEFERFLAAYADHEKAPLARYGLGVGQFRLGRCPEAVAALSPLRDRTEFEYSPEVLMILGQCALGEKDFAAAAKAFDQVASRFPGHVLADDAAAAGVEANYGAGEFERALSSAKRFVERFSESPLRDRVEFFGASSAMSRKEFPAAGEAFASIASRTKDGALADRAAFYAAQSFEQTGDASRAIKQYGKVLERKDSAYAADALLALAQLAERQERYDEAGKLVDHVLEKFPRSELIPSARLLRGRVWFAQGKREQAAPIFDSLSGDSSLDREMRCEAAYHAARIRLRNESYADAARSFQGVVERFPGCSWEAEARYDLGVSFWKAESLDDAFDAFRGLRDAFPNHDLSADALHAQAGIELRRKRFDESARLAREFVDRFSQHKLAPAAAFLIAESDFLAGRTAESIETFRSFLARFPNDTRIADARSRLGAALYRVGKLDEAEPFLKEAGEFEAHRTATGATPSTPRELAPVGAQSSLVALGDVYFQRGEWKQAEEVLTRYLQAGDAAPASEDAILRVGLAQTRQGRSEEALQSFDRLLARFPRGKHRAQAVFEKAQTLIAMERRDDAETSLRAVLDDGAAERFHAPTLRHLAALSMQKRGFAAAATYFQRLSEKSELAADKRSASYQRGVALMAAQDFPAARAVFAPLTREVDDAALRAASLAQVGSALVRENRCSDAVEAFGEIAGGWSAVADTSLRAAAQYDQAGCLRELGRTDDAAQAFRRLAEADASGELSAYALLDLANLEASAKNWDAAVALLTKLLAVSANADRATGGALHEVIEHAQYRLGICEFERGWFAECLKALDGFLARFPESPLVASATFFAGESAFRSQRWDVAVRHFGRLIEQFPSDPSVDTAYLRLGDSLVSQQRWPESERAYADYLSRFGDREQWFAAQFGVGWSRENQQKYDDAVGAYEKVVARHEGQTAARAQFQIGECRFAQKRFDDAVRELLKVDILYAYPEWKAAALFEAGRGLEELKKMDEARGQFRRVIESHAGTRWAELAAKRLSELSAAATGR